MNRRTIGLALMLTLPACIAAAGSSVARWSALRPTAREGVVHLPSTASIWLADTIPGERNTSAGRFALAKLKTIQEMVAIRFDATVARGYEVLSARLFLHTAGAHMLRYLRVSTVSQNWIAGTSQRPYGPASGATYLWADAATQRPWSYAGSEFADVVMGSGHTLTTFAELRKEAQGWISVPLTRELVHALAIGHTDGLAVMDGGTPAFFNNFIHSAQAGDHAPYVEVELGDPLAGTPPAPRVVAEPAPARAHMTTGAIRIAIEPDPAAFSWRLELDGQPVPRWQVPLPPAVSATGREQDQIRPGQSSHEGPVVFHLDDLDPQRVYNLSVAAVARSGAASPAVHVRVSASGALPEPARLEPLTRPTGTVPTIANSTFAVWPVPGLVKISPETGASMFRDMAGEGRATEPNAVWNGRTIRLFGARGEYVSYQLVIERVDRTRPLNGIVLAPADLTGPGGVIGGDDIEVYRNWYARNGDGDWQPSYAVPLAPAAPIDIPDRQRRMDGQRNQSIYVDIYIPRDTSAGTYTGTVTVTAGTDTATLPVEVQVYDIDLPDKLRFLAELNAYAVPDNALDFHRLAHQHRLAFNPWALRPGIEHAGGDARVQWEAYDSLAGPLLSGDAFAGSRRARVPTPVMYLPFIDSWPTPLTPDTYRYGGHWPGQGGPLASIVDHYMTAPYIGDGLSPGYQAAFLSVQRQFVEHFKARGWDQTEMQLFFGGKNTHRLDYGSNMWWTTDEPYHWDDWLALQFFGHLWARGRATLGADLRVWSVRADISRPMWAGRVLDTIVDRVYWGGFSNVRWYRRAAWLSEYAGMRPRVYGAANSATESNTESVSTLLHVWLHGADGFMPWQTIGNDASLDSSDNVGGNTLMVPGARFGLPVVADLRLKALRDGEQLVEYLVILADRRQLQREQIRAMLEKVLTMSATTSEGASLDDAEAMRLSSLEAWQIAGLRRQLAELIVVSPPAR